MTKRKIMFHKNLIEYRSSLREWFWGSYIYRIYHYITKTFPERLGRSVSYFIKGWHNYDFDNHYVNEMVLFKLKRLRHCFLNYGDHSEECPNYKLKMKSLNLAIKLLERVCESNYHKFYDLHEKKWGERKYNFAKEGELYTMHTEVENANTPELQKQEEEERFEAYLKDDKMEARDKRIAYAIIGKYQNYWWD